jgi:hexulose-6-phosphate isomerase
MKKSICYWSFPGGLDGSKDVCEAIEEAAEYGYDAIELCIGGDGEVTPDTSEGDCRRFAEKAEEVGVEIASVASGLWWEANFSDPDESVRASAVETAKKSLQVTGWLGTDALLTIPGAVDVFFDPDAPVVPYSEVMKRCKEGIKEILPVAEECGVTAAVEVVWNKFLLSPIEMADFVDSFDSDRVGVYMDVGNVMPFGYPQQWIRHLGDRITRVHFKDFKTAVGTAEGFCDLLEGDVNWPEVVSALDEIGYAGYCTAEMIPLYPHHPEVRVANTSNAMDAILGR